MFLFVADLALTLAFKVGAWCVGKTYDGVVYLVKRTSKTPPPPHATYDISDDDDCVLVTIK
jgi:hypothetical protein